MNTELRETIENYLDENRSVAIEVARELNSWNGSFPEFDTWDLYELADCMCNDYESTRRFLDDVIYAAESGEFNNHNTNYDLVRYDELGRLEIRSDYELEEEVHDYIDEIIDAIEEHYPNDIDIYDDELKKLLENETESEED